MRRLAPLLLLCLALTTASAKEAGIPAYRVPDALSSAAPERPRLVAGLVAAIVNEEGRDCLEAWKVLAGLGRTAMPETVKGLARTPWFGRSLLMAAVAESGTPEVEPVLLLGTRDPAWAVREMAAFGLRHTDGPGAGKSLRDLLQDPSWRVRQAAAASLRWRVVRGGVSRDEAVAALLPLASSRDRDLRLTAVSELGLLRAGQAWSAFLRGYSEDDEKIREACFTALTHLESTGEALAAAMEAALDRSEEEVFLQAAEKYAELTGALILEDENHVHRLLQALNGNVLGASRVFRKIGRPAVPVLLAELRRRYRPVRVPAVGDLAQVVLDLVQSILGEEAAPVLAMILKEWTEALPARRHAAVLARRYHARALSGTLKELYPEEGFADIRSALLRGIAASDPPDLAKHLESAILSGNPELQKAAHEILVRREEIEVDGALVTALEAERHNHLIAKRWLALLTDRGRPAAFAQAKKLLARPNPEFRQVGAEGLGRFPDREEVLPLLDAAFRKEDGRHWERDLELEAERLDTRRRATLRTILKSAGDVAGVEALELLGRAAESADPVVREYALHEVAGIRDERALQVALRALAEDTDPAVLKEARRAVVAYDTAEVRAIVADRLSGPDEREREATLTALRVVGDARVPEVLLTALAEGEWEPEARIMAVAVLDAHRDAAHVPLLVSLLESDPDPELKAEVIGALGEIGSPAAIGPLLALLPEEGRDFEDLPVGERGLALLALEALGDLRAAVAVPRLLSLTRREWPLALRDHTPERHHFHAASLLVSTLGRIGDSQAIPILVELLFTPELHRQFALLDAAPPRNARRQNLLGVLIAALVRFPDKSLAVAGRKTIDGLRSTGEVYGMDEGYLLHVARLLADPRHEGIGRPRPRRSLAAEFHRLVLAVVPRRSSADRIALAWLSHHAAETRRFREAADHQEACRALTELLDPLGYAKLEDYYLAEVDFLVGMALMDEGKAEEGLSRYRQGRERDPEDPQILNLFAWWLADTGRHLDEALEAALAAGRRAASDPNVIDTLGWTLHRLGRHREAANRLFDAKELDEEDSARDPLRLPAPILVYHLAAASSRAGYANYSSGFLARAIAMDDTLANAARSSPDFEPLREKGLLSETIDRALESIGD